MKKIILIAICYTLTFGNTFANEKAITDRQAAMKTIRESVKILFPMAKGRSEYDGFLATSLLEDMLEVAKPYKTFFPKGSELGWDTEAAPTIWSNRSEFDIAADQFVSDLEIAIEFAPEELKEFQPLFKKVTSNCGNCHETFRIKK